LTKAESQVDVGTFMLLEAMAKAASELEIEWMVTGAAGRVLLLEGVRIQPVDATDWLNRSSGVS
jgi:hypothetical protein